MHAIRTLDHLEMRAACDRLEACRQFDVQLTRHGSTSARPDVEEGAVAQDLSTAQRALASRPDDGALSGRARAAHGISRDDVVQLVVQHLLEGLHV